MTTRAEIRRLLTDFRAMVRARGPGELLEVAALSHYQIPVGPGDAYDPIRLREIYRWHKFRERLPRRAAVAALRWWRWANRQERWVEVRRYCHDDGWCCARKLWDSDELVADD